MKSNVSGHLEISASIYKDACAKCIADVSDLRDLFTMRSRVKDEGVSFLTITLPEFCKDFESALQSGFIDPSLFKGFKKSGAIPAFLQGMLGRVFNRETGRIYDESTGSFSEESITIIDGVRQICLAFKRMELTCTPERVAQTFENFIKLEQSEESFSVPEEDASEFRLVSSVLWDNMLGDLRLDMLSPRHGPGATSERIMGNQKYVWKYWHERLEPFIPILENAYSISAFRTRELEEVTFVTPDTEIPVRVVAVPKTLKAPRIIAIEPSCMQYVQQAIRRVLYSTIESSRLTTGHINFRDQVVNQELALVGSSSGRLATIDLSDASDRVPRELALEMFRGNPDLRDAIDASRTNRAKMPDGTLVSPLRKFASMGSALCFPVESMYFYTICVAALLRAHELPVSHANCYKVSRDVYVYGDDIIVPSANAIVVLDYLRKYKCKVNSSKTFVTGKFRESCGTDAYNGSRVTPVYLRKDRPENKHQVPELISWVSTANSFYLKGYWNTAQLMWHACERILGSLPYVSETSSALGRISLLGYRSVERWNRKLHRFEVEAWVPRPVYRSDSIDGYAALQKCLLKMNSREGDLPLEDLRSLSELSASDFTWKIAAEDPRNLERFALHGKVALTRRWVPST